MPANRRIDSKLASPPRSEHAPGHKDGDVARLAGERASLRHVLIVHKGPFARSDRLIKDDRPAGNLSFLGIIFQILVAVATTRRHK